MIPTAFPHPKRLVKFLVYRRGFWSISQYQDFGETIGNKVISTKNDQKFIEVYKK